jgi:pilus assembly protein Flp/PilA
MPEPAETIGENWQAPCIHHGMTLLRTRLLSAVSPIRRFLNDENGQDLVEYALVVALIALGATASMSSLATSFSTAFSSIGSKTATYVS